LNSLSIATGPRLPVITQFPTPTAVHHTTAYSVRLIPLHHCVGTSERKGKTKFKVSLLIAQFFFFFFFANLWFHL
jgi:hypothetical protein